MVIQMNRSCPTFCMTLTLNLHRPHVNRLWLKSLWDNQAQGVRREILGPLAVHDGQQRLQGPLRNFLQKVSNEKKNHNKNRLLPFHLLVLTRGQQHKVHQVVLMLRGHRLETQLDSFPVLDRRMPDPMLVLVVTVFLQHPHNRKRPFRMCLRAPQTHLLTRD